MQGCPLAIQVSVQRLLGTCTRTEPLPSRTKLRSRSIVSARKTAIELHRDNLDAARRVRPSPAHLRTARVVRATVNVTEELDRLVTSLRTFAAALLIASSPVLHVAVLPPGNFLTASLCSWNAIILPMLNQIPDPVRQWQCLGRTMRHMPRHPMWCSV